MKYLVKLFDINGRLLQSIECETEDEAYATMEREEMLTGQYGYVQVIKE